MRVRLWQATQVVLVLGWVGCDFKPPSAGENGTGGSAGTTGAAGAPVKGTGGSPSTGTGGSTASGGAVGTGGTGSGDINITGAGGQSCGQTNVSIKPLPPDILIVQDKSGSMSDPPGQNCTGANCSKWSQVSSAIDTVVQATDTNVNWGMTFFPIDSTCGLEPTPVVPVGPTNSQPIQAAFAGNQPTGKTPTAAALNAAVAYMKTLTDPNPKFLLLATDGLPNCGANAPMISTDDSAAAEMAVTDAMTAGFPTFVVGIATSTDATATNTLNAMAINGGYPQTGATTQYYSVTDTASLQTVLNKIIGMTLACTIPLTDKPANLANVAVSAQDANGNRIQIPQDPTNGWSFDATMSNIVLNGSACIELQSVMLTQYQFIYACEGVKICIDTHDCSPP
jgi:hypothetical protein